MTVKLLRIISRGFNMLITNQLVISRLPKRPAGSNKGTFGSVMVIAGSENFPGAAILSVLAAARSGAGLVTLSTINSVYEVAVSKIPFATFLKFSEIENNLDKYDSVLLGPGLGINGEAVTLIKKLVNSDKFINKKLVVDADALNVLSEVPLWYLNFKTDAIVTPHPGEMSRLTGLSVEDIQKNRKETTLKFSKLWNKTIVLKGSGTVIADPGGKIYLSPFSNPLLATAGTGDVLAGIIAGFLAQGLSLIDAAVAGVYIHGLSGEKLRDRFGDRGATAMDLVESLPSSFKELLSV